MKTLQYLFYIYFLAGLRRFGKELDYSYSDAIFTGLLLSIFVSFNVLTIFIILGCVDIIINIVQSLGLVSSMFFLVPSFVFIYFSCIYNKKYLEIVERFKYVDKNWKSRLLSAFLGFLYIFGSTALLGLSYFYFK